MRIFLYEFVTGGGWYSESEASPPESLVIEGRAMLQSLAADLAAIEGVRVDVLADRRCETLAIPHVTVHPVGSAAEERAAWRQPPWQPMGR